MRILYLNYLHDIHGASFGSAIKPRRILEEMSKMGHDIHVEWMAEEMHGERIRDYVQGRKSKLREFAGFFLREPKSLYHNWAYFQKENELVETFRPELIVGRLEYATFSFVKTAKKYNLPLIVEVDAPPFYEAKHFHPKCLRNPWLAFGIEKYVTRRADYSIMQSRQLYEYYLNHAKLDPEKTTWTSNGADIEKFAPTPKNPKTMKKYELNGKSVIGFIGSLGTWHGLDNLLHMIESVVQSNAQAVFMIVGAGGTDEIRFREILKNKNLMQNVILTGHIDYDKVPEYLDLMDVVLAPYPAFDFFYFSPIKLFEYMAAGKPVLLTKVGQLAEIIKDRENGVFCDPKDPADVAQKINHLLENPELRKHIGKKARETIEKEYTWKHKAKFWESICEQVLKQKKDSGSK